MDELVFDHPRGKDTMIPTFLGRNNQGPPSSSLALTFENAEWRLNSIAAGSGRRYCKTSCMPVDQRGHSGRNTDAKRRRRVAGVTTYRIRWNERAQARRGKCTCVQTRTHLCCSAFIANVPWVQV